MKKMISSLPAKAAAAFLFFFSAIVSVACGFGVAAAYQLGYYHDVSSWQLVAGHERLCEFVHDMRIWFIILGVLGIAAFFVSLIFLMCSAGHRRDVGGIALGFFSRIPADLYAIAVGFLFCCSLMLLGGAYGWGFYGTDPVLTVLIAAFLCGLTALCVLAFLTNFAVRVKAGKWWRNSVTFYVLRFFWRMLRSTWHILAQSFRSLPQTWQVALGYVGFWLANLICMLFILINLINNDSYPGVILGIIMFLALDLAAGAVLVLSASQMKKLRSAASCLAKGRFDTKIDTASLFWEFKRHGEDLNSIGSGMSLAVDERMRSERLKTELITNVSHDIKTPLTSIVNYVDLLKKSPSPEKREEYLEVLSRQSSRLRRLTEDLVEASKASTGNMNVELVPTDLEELINQALGEYAGRLSAGQLEVVFSPPPHSVTVMADGRLLWRILDNLLSNVCKYAQSGTRVYVDVTCGEGGALVSIKNISRDRLNISADELMERFVRGDSARSGEGSGLGLNIAKSLAELQHGKLSLSVDGDLFKATLYLPKAR